MSDHDFAVAVRLIRLGCTRIEVAGLVGLAPRTFDQRLLERAGCNFRQLQTRPDA